VTEHNQPVEAAIHRPALDAYFLEIATVVARRSTCVARQVGAVAVLDKHILAAGYNGVPLGVAHPTVCLRRERGLPPGAETFLCGCVHAEMNIIAQAAFHGTSLKGATVYCTNQPCHLCAMLLINAGVARVVYEHPYPDEAAVGLFEKAGVTLEGKGQE
jgi:dCMP deaminase